MNKRLRLLIAILAVFTFFGFTGCDTPASTASDAGTTGTLRIANNATNGIDALFIDPYNASYDVAVNPLGPNQISSIITASGGIRTIANIPAGDYSVRLHYVGDSATSYTYFTTKAGVHWKIVIKPNVENKLTFNVDGSVSFSSN